MKKQEDRALWRLAGPLIISNISIALLGIVDTTVVGHLDQPYYLGAVAIAGVIFSFLYWGMGFLRMGTTGIIAQAHGEADNNKIRSALVHSQLIALFIAILFLLGQTGIASIAFGILGASDEVTKYAQVYFNCAIWGAPAVLLSMTLFGWLLGMQNARATLIFALVQNGVNIVLDLVFVFGFNMDVFGVALASVISQYCGFLLGIVLVHRELELNRGEWLRNQICDFSQLKSMLSLNRNIFICTICLIFVFAFFAREGARQNDVILAANVVLMNFQAITALGLDGFANATEALIGKAIGSGDHSSFNKSVKSALYWSLVISLALMLVYFLTGRHIILLMTGIDEVIVAANLYLPWLIISPLVSVWCFLLDGIFIGAVRGKEMRNSMLVSTFLVFLPAWYLLRMFGNHGLWLALLIFFCARGASLGWYYFKIEKRGSGFISVS
ncbi:MAG: MATE family efflux transporter [Gammaproteobacteria bacterium]|nr:MATE family efflux transporter [Gammaproteobacteria bacterium]